MRNLSINRKQLVHGFLMALIIGIAEFLVMMILGLFGLWTLVVEIFAIAIMLSLIVLLSLEIRRTLIHLHLMYTPVLFAPYTLLFFPNTPFREQKRVEQMQEEDFKPFVL